MLNTLHIPARVGLLALAFSVLGLADDRFVIKVDGDVNAVAGRHHLTVVKSLNGSGNGVHVVSGPAGVDRQQVLQALKQDSSVRGAEPESLLLLPGVGSKTNPNPTANRLAPAIHLDGTPTFYYTGFAAAAYVNQQAAQIINVAKSHALATGNGVKVAVIDTGIDRTHPVLMFSVGEGYDFVTNSNGGQELLGTNQETTPILDQETTPILDQETTPILDGGSAVIFAQETTPILDQETTPILDQETTPILDSKQYPAFGHGTMVAGLIHLVAPNARLLPVRAFGANGTSTISQVVAAIYWSIDHAANVINMSFSTTQDSPQLQAAIDAAAAKGIILVAAAGNDGKATQVWPASYSDVIGVASTNNSLIRSSFSNYGNSLVTLAAPGEADVTVYPGNHYAQVWGTSFSTPLVAGGAALLVDINNKTDEATADKTLSKSAKNIGQELGGGELDLYQACLSTASSKGHN
jgi:subtilisin family serine protease